jgi:hypothetical protein
VVVSGGGAAPRLEALEFVGAEKPCFLLVRARSAHTRLRALTAAAGRGRALRPLHFALAPVPGDEPPLVAAAKLARALPRLELATFTRLAPGRRGALPRRLAPPPEWLACVMAAGDDGKRGGDGGSEGGDDDAVALLGAPHDALTCLRARVRWICGLWWDE